MQTASKKHLGWLKYLVNMPPQVVLYSKSPHKFFAEICFRQHKILYVLLLASIFKLKETIESFGENVMVICKIYYSI
jgi:hypothetical protein